MKATSGHRPATHKWLVIAAAMLWITLASAIRLYGFDPANDYAAHLNRQEIARCWGSVSRRYECRSAIDVSDGQRVFLLWSMNLAIIFGPPILLAMFFRKRSQKAWREAEEKRRRKAAAAILRIHKPNR